jgi:hypothetical protein
MYTQENLDIYLDTSAVWSTVRDVFLPIVPGTAGCDRMENSD